jgi:hypothetical protein
MTIILRAIVLIRLEALMGLPEYEVTGIEEVAGEVRIAVRFKGSGFLFALPG